MDITRVPLYQQAYELIRARIVDGSLSLGSRLDVQTLADDFGISRTPIREAIRQLSQEGLVEIERDGRARIYNPSPEALAEIFTIRASLESMAAVTACFNRNLDLADLKDSLARSEDSHAAGDWQGTVTANSDFHAALISASRNTRIISTIASMEVHIRRYRTLSMQFQDRQKSAIDAHRLILDSVIDGNCNVAASASYNHVLRSGAFAIQQLQPDDSKDTPPMALLRATWGDTAGGAIRRP